MKISHIAILLLVPVIVFFVGAGAGQDAKEKSHWKAFLPADVYKELVKRELKTIQESIGSTERKVTRKGKVAAVMIAGYTKSLAPKAKVGDVLGVREAALRLAMLIGEEGKADEAKQLVKAIADFQGVSKAKNEGFRLRSYFLDDMDLMRPYMERTKGGDGLHPDLQVSARLKGTQEFVENLFSYIGRRPLRERYLDKVQKEMTLLGYRTAVSAELIETFAPTKKRRDRDPAVWHSSSQEMREGGIALAKGASKKDADAMNKAANKILKSCVDCHKMFQ